jgi:hypothetical protein
VGAETLVVVRQVPVQVDRVEPLRQGSGGVGGHVHGQRDRHPRLDRRTERLAAGRTLHGPVLGDPLRGLGGLERRADERPQARLGRRPHVVGTVTGPPQRRVRARRRTRDELAHRQALALAGALVVLAGERLLRQQTRDELDRPVRRRTGAGAGDPERRELDRRARLGERDRRAAARERVEGRDRRGQARRVLDPRVRADRPQSQAEPAGAGRDRAEDHLGRPRVLQLLLEVPLGHPDAREPQGLRAHGDVDELAEPSPVAGGGPGARVERLEQQREPHRGPR